MQETDLSSAYSQAGPLRVLMVGPGLQVKGGISSVERLIMKYSPQDVQIVHVSTSEDGGALKKAWAFLLGGVKFICLSARCRPQVVHIHFSKRGSTWRKWFIMLMALCFRIPVILHAHSGDFPPFFDSLPKLLRKAVVTVFRRAAALVTLSYSWRDYYAAQLHIPLDLITVLPNPVEIPESPATTTASAVTYLGKISKEKGAFDLIEAYARIPPDTRRESRLIMAGNGDVALAREQVARLGIQNEVTIANWLTPFERDNLLQDTRVFALPSYYEGLPMSLLEAMSHGVAVLTTPVGGIPEIVDDGTNGVLVPVGSVECLAEKLEVLLHNLALCQELGAHARATVSDFGVEQYMQKLVRVYQRNARLISLSSLNEIRTDYPGLKIDGISQMSNISDKKHS